jgi:hypothetical protein
VFTIRSSSRLSPRYWALATFFIPIAGAITYGIWLGISAAGLAQSSRSEAIVRSIASLILSAIFLPIARPWTRAIGIGFLCALIFMLMGVVQFEVFRGR